MTKEEYNKLSIFDRIKAIEKAGSTGELTFSEIADELGVTKNTIAGMVWRYKINVVRRKVAKEKPPKSNVPVPISAIAATPAPVVPKLIKVDELRKTLAKSDLWLPLPGSKPIKLMDAKPKEGCRWLVGYHQYCNEPGYPFCAVHSRHAYTNQGDRDALKQT